MLRAVSQPRLSGPCLCWHSPEGQGAGPGRPGWLTAEVGQASPKIGSVGLSSDLKDGEAGNSGWMHEPEPVWDGRAKKGGFPQPSIGTTPQVWGSLDCLPTY